MSNCMVCEELSEALEAFGQRIARTEYGGSKWIMDKPAIAAGFERREFSEFCGAIVDTASGRVWVVEGNSADCFTYHRVN